ncbi:SusE domain-containing protein [Flavobacterium cellulosilyticum]|uniref:SusE outer membrane protein domain-containing protein n=1 Tax=Flavobacterium cellulosilyticum TaxID=2541731 RepID=A0A4V2Z012_9FLAO|nr:SusE domain-containing protein [Flavobacterium cellulosilyticum]TDD99247.1 hypothetical protein E0F76_00530 [Flavobacterium cellulosilyticum]
MKNILKITTFAFLLISFASCTDVIDPMVAPIGLALKVPAPNGPFVLSPLDGDNLVTTLTWDAADSGVATASPKYTVEIAKAGTNFAKSIVASTTSTDLKAVWQESFINALLLDNGFIPDTAVDLDIRVKSVLGESANPFVQYSNTVTLKVTPFAQVTFAFTKNTDNPANAPKMISSGLYTSDSEGYAWLEAGAYKFYTSVGGVYQSTNPYYGDNGSGALVLNGAAINVATAGFYMLKANIGTTPKTYSITSSEWGVYGLATPFPTALNKKMTYNATTKKWELTITLSGGKPFRFRNTATTLILGGYDETVVGANYAGKTMTYNGKDIYLAGTTPASYKIALDLNTPRAYTYTITKQ